MSKEKTQHSPVGRIERLLASDKGQDFIYAWGFGDKSHTELAEMLEFSPKIVSALIRAEKRRVEKTGGVWVLPRKARFEERADEIRRQYARGVDKTTLSGYFNKDAVANALKGVPENPLAKPVRSLSEKTAEIESRLMLGEKQVDIALAVGASRQWVHQVAKKLGLAKKRYVPMTLEQSVSSNPC